MLAFSIGLHTIYWILRKLTLYHQGTCKGSAPKNSPCLHQNTRDEILKSLNITFPCITMFPDCREGYWCLPSADSIRLTDVSRCFVWFRLSFCLPFCFCIWTSIVPTWKKWQKQPFEAVFERNALKVVEMNIFCNKLFNVWARRKMSTV